MAIDPPMMAGKKHAPEYLGRILVLGLGISGKAAVRYLLPALGGRVASLTVATDTNIDAARTYAASNEALGVEVLFGDYELTGIYDLCIASPGISQFSPLYILANSLCAELISEVEFAWRESSAESRWIAVTGTNGKTTTTAMIAHVLQTSGRAAVAVGNIGDTCLDAVEQGVADIFVAETSSYQLASTSLFAPNIAILLNITPDHLHWHRSFDAYEQAKLKVLANLSTTPGAIAVLGAVDPLVRETIKRIKDIPAVERGYDYVPIGTKEGLSFSMRDACGSDNAAYVCEGSLCVETPDGKTAFILADELLVKGQHNVENALAAAAAAHALGCDWACIGKGLATFAPLPHRIEPAGSVRGVRCYNDSKATNVDAALHALTAFGDDRVIALFGGEDKDTDLADLVKLAEKHCQGVVCFGAASARFNAAFEHAAVPVYSAATMEPALDVALEHAHKGDVVVLSPACASFDEFVSFEQRGAVFKALVAQRAEVRGA